MKLSEAIRLGAMMKPQGFGFIYKNGKTCALGAYLDAFGLCEDYATKKTMPEWKEWWENIPLVKIIYSRVAPPMNILDSPEGRLNCIIAILNDQYRWTREQIADWVATIEPQEDGLSETVLERVTTRTAEGGRLDADITAAPASEDAPAQLEVLSGSTRID